MKAYLLDKIVPALIMGLIFGAINTYIDVQLLKREFRVLEENYQDIVVQINNQLVKK